MKAVKAVTVGDTDLSLLILSLLSLHHLTLTSHPLYMPHPSPFHRLPFPILPRTPPISGGGGTASPASSLYLPLSPFLSTHWKEETAFLFIFVSFCFVCWVVGGWWCDIFGIFSLLLLCLI